MLLKVLSKEDIGLIKRVMQYVKPYKFSFILLIACILSALGFGLVQPYIFAKLLNNLFTKRMDLVLNNILIFSLLYFLQLAINFVQTYLFSYVNNNLIYDLKCDIYSNILRLPTRTFDQMSSGEFTSRLHSDSESIANIITNQLLSAIIDFFSVIVIGITVFSISVPLAMIIVIAFPISYIIFLFFGRKLRKKNVTLKKMTDIYFTNIQQSVNGIREVKTLCIKDKMYKLFEEVSTNLKKKSVEVAVLGSLAQTLSSLVNYISQVSIIAVGGYMIFKSILSMELYIAFTSYAKQFSNSLVGLTKLNSNIQQALVSLKRIFDVVDNFGNSREKYGSLEVSVVNGSVEFNNVYFAYEAETILNGVNFKIHENSITAIVGRSGSGKSTIASLLAGLYKHKSGNIYIDGIDIDDFSENSLKNCISIVRQEPYLFNMTIKENLLLAHSGASDDEIIKACEKAFIHNFIMKLPEQYNTLVGDNGINLSGGEKQRLAIARAILKNTKIIIFDESTSSLDNHSQAMIKKSIKELARDKTIIIIAHRFSNVIEADNILVIGNGRVLAQGLHDSLKQNSHLYRELFNAEYERADT